MTVSLLDQGQMNQVTALGDKAPLSLLILQLGRWLVCVALQREKFSSPTFLFVLSLATPPLNCYITLQVHTSTDIVPPPYSEV